MQQPFYFYGLKSLIGLDVQLVFQLRNDDTHGHVADGVGGRACEVEDLIHAEQHAETGVGDAERRGFTGYGDTYTKLAIFTEAVVELYCHLRQKLDLSKRMADEMDINLEVFNLETDFFGDLHCSSRFTDMLCDALAQYGDYSELEKCPMWGM